jgi:hypothetical protein
MDVAGALENPIRDSSRQTGNLLDKRKLHELHEFRE